jgi:hypothetical protein
MPLVRIAAVCLALLFAASARADLQIYDVDFKYQREVYEALRGILVNNPGNAMPGSAYGRVEQLPTGQILVDAAPNTHVQIARLLEAVRARQVDVAPRVTLRYWVVLGGAAAEERDRTPDALSDVLTELERVHGDLSFRVIGTATLVTESGQEGEVDGLPLSVMQRAYVQGDTATAEIEMRLRIVQLAVYANGPMVQEPELTLNVTLQRGEFLVLGESTVRTDDLDGTLFYIVHWPEGD